jgi:hypothetical protein
MGEDKGAEIPQELSPEEVGDNFLARSMAEHHVRGTKPQKGLKDLAKVAHNADPEGFMDKLMGAIGELLHPKK